MTRLVVLQQRLIADARRLTEVTSEGDFRVDPAGHVKLIHVACVGDVVACEAGVVVASIKLEATVSLLVVVVVDVSTGTTASVAREVMVDVEVVV